MKRVRKKRGNTNLSKKLPEVDIPEVPKWQCKPSFKLKFNEDHPRLIYFLTLLGCNLTQIAQVLDVDITTISDWKRKFPQVNEALEKGKEIADAEVAHSLYQAAVGYSHPHQVILTNRKKEYNDEGKVIREWTEPLIVDTVKHYSPDTKAAIKWLSARKPEIWGNKLEVKGKITMHHQVDLSKFSDEELKLLGKLGLEENNPEDVPYEDV